MEYINCQQKVRPLHFAFAISLSDEKSIMKAVEYSTALWGGLGNIFIPIWKRFPNMQIKSRCLGLIKDFDPDFIVNLTSIPLPRCIKENYKERIISKNSFVVKDSKNNTFRFENGLSVLALMAHVWETETKLISGKSRAVIFEDIDSNKYHNFWAFLFGKYPCKFERDYSSFFKKTLKAKEIKASFNNLCKLEMDEVVPPISLTTYHLTRYGRSGGFSSHILYVGDPTKNLDLIEFWNIRASGKRIFFLPTNAYKLFGKQVKGFIKSGDYQINKSVQNKADIQKSPSITNDEFGFVCDWIKNDLGYSLSRRSWLPNWGRKLERIAEDISPCEYYDKEVKNNLIFDRDRFSPLVLDRPSFLSKSSFQRLNRPYNRERKCWVNEIQLNDNYKNDYFFNFPSDKALTDIVSRKFIFGYPNKVRLTKGVVVYYNDGFTDEVNIHPIKTDRVIAELFKYHGMDISLSVAGLFAKRIIDYMGEIDDCRVFKIRGIRKILIELSNNKPSFGKAYGDIKGVVNSREKDEFGGPNWDNIIYKDLVLYYQQSIPLNPMIAIDHLFKKNILRAGLRLTCENCGKEDWYHLTEFSSTFICRYCFKSQHIGSLEGNEKKEWHYKSDGLFMIPNVGEGSLAVILALWRLHSFHQGGGFKYLTSQYIKSEKDTEVDFIAMMVNHFQVGDVLILGEARNYVDFSRKDVNKLMKIASKFSAKPYLCFVTLKDEFSDKEKEELKRVIKRKFGLIPFTRLELDPYDLYDRFSSLKNKYATTIEELSFNLCSLNLGISEEETYDFFHAEEKKVFEKFIKSKKK